MATAPKLAFEYIVKEPGYCSGKAAIGATRVRVNNVVFLHKQGKTVDEIRIVAGRFPLYTDADVRGPFIQALRSAGWDIVRAIDELAEGAFESLARQDAPFSHYPIVRIWPRR